jgi:hypothetical protein
MTVTPKNKKPKAVKKLTGDSLRKLGGGNRPSINWKDAALAILESVDHFGFSQAEGYAKTRGD